MAGRKPIFNREEQRKNQVVVPLSEQEKNQIKEAATANVAPLRPTKGRDRKSLNLSALAQSRTTQRTPTTTANSTASILLTARA